MFRKPGDLWELLLLNGATQGSKIIVSLIQTGLQQRTARVKQMPVKAGAKRGMVCQWGTTLPQAVKLVFERL